MLLLLAAIVPLLLLELASAFTARRAQAEAIGQQVAQLARLTSASVSELFEGERQLLIAMSRLPAVAALDAEACNAALADLLAQYPFYANLAAITPAGITFCSGVPQAGPGAVVSDRTYFQRAIATGQFALGDYSVGRVSGLPVIVGAYPLIMEGEVRAVVIASLKLEYLHNLLAAAQLPAGAALTVFDANATILSRSPDPDVWVGQTRPDAPVIAEALVEEAGATTARGIDGVERLYAYAVVADTGPASLYVAMGIPTQVAYADVYVTLGRNLGALATVALLAVTIGWFGSSRLVLDPVQRLLAATERLAAGDLAARTGASPGPGELKQLALAFDSMAEALDRRQTQLATVNRLLKMLSECNQALVRATSEADLLDSVTRNIVQFGGYPLAWVSLARPNAEAPRLTALAGAESQTRVRLEPTGHESEPAPSLAQETLSKGRAVVIDDLASQPVRASLREALASTGCTAVLALPISLQGQGLGALCLGLARLSAYQQDELRLLEELAGDLAYGLTALRSDRARESAEAQIRASGERSSALADLSRRLAEVTTEVTAVGRATVDCAVAGIGDGAVLELVGAGDDRVEVLAWAHRQPQAAAQLRQQLPYAAVPLEDSLARQVLAAGQASQDAGATNPGQLERFGANRWLSVPLRAQGTLLGALSLFRTPPSPAYNAAEQEFLQAIADRAALAISNVRLYTTALHLNAELEQRVAERTAQLAASNRALEGENIERRRAEGQVRQLNAALQERAAALETANRELEAFSYSVSHDLRAPLRSIDGFSLALLEDYGGQLDATASDYLRRVRAAAQRMAALIDDLLNLSRVARAEMHWEPVDLSALAHTVAAELQQTAPQRQAEFRLAPDLKALGDGRLLRVMLENLLGNAWKFTAGQALTVITFERQEVEGHSAYVVRDNGAGFDMTYAHRLFGAFQRLHDQSEYPGTGIGLATVQRIVHRHGGRVWAEGTVGAGAAFFFSLPDTPPSDQAAAMGEKGA